MRSQSLAFASFLLLGSCASEKIALGLRLEPGQSFGVAMVMEQDVAQDYGEHELETSQRIAITWREEVESVKPDGTAVVAFVYETARFAIDGPETGLVEYDSAAPGPSVPPFALGLDAVVGERVRLEIGPTGEIRSLTDVTHLVDRVIAKLVLPAGVDPAAVRDDLRRHFGEDALREMLQTVLSIYPDREVGVGDQWTRRMQVTRGFPHEQTNTYELRDFDDERAVVSIRSKVKSLAAAPSVRSGLTQMQLDLEGTQRGRLTIDRRTGMVVVAEILQDLEGTLTTSIPGVDPLVTDMELSGRIQLAVDR